ncbi:unnamed protein product, partial [Meganyctiphanes norvegica]
MSRSPWRIRLYPVLFRFNSIARVRNRQIIIALNSFFLLYTTMEEHVNINVKEEIEVYEEPVLSQDIEVTVKEECKSHLGNKLKALSCNSHILNHQSAHTSEKTHQCNQWVKDDSQKGKILGQRKTHTYVKQHQCNQCCKEFSLKSNLTRHQDTHTE